VIDKIKRVSAPKETKKKEKTAAEPKVKAAPIEKVVKVPIQK
jgi:hypothetical protein